jgi:hypothetical protein
VRSLRVAVRTPGSEELEQRLLATELGKAGASPRRRLQPEGGRLRADREQVRVRRWERGGRGLAFDPADAGRGGRVEADRIRGLDEPGRCVAVGGRGRGLRRRRSGRAGGDQDADDDGDDDHQHAGPSPDEAGALGERPPPPDRGRDGRLLPLQPRRSAHEPSAVHRYARMRERLPLLRDRNDPLPGRSDRRAAAHGRPTAPHPVGRSSAGGRCVMTRCRSPRPSFAPCCCPARCACSATGLVPVTLLDWLPRLERPLHCS